MVSLLYPGIVLLTLLTVNYTQEITVTKNMCSFPFIVGDLNIVSCQCLSLTCHMVKWRKFEVSKFLDIYIHICNKYNVKKTNPYPDLMQFLLDYHSVIDY